MATTKERILVTLTPEMSRSIRAIAKREQSPKATIAARLMREALVGIPTVQLSPEGERRALKAIAASKKAAQEGGLIRLEGSLADLL
jgi:hypothetical protein